MSDSHLQVHIRIRPHPADDLVKSNRRPCIEVIDKSSVSAAVAPNRYEQLSFDAINGPESSQDQLFQSVAKNICDACLEGSYVEIYNEMIFDLLSDGGNRQLALREDSKKGMIFVEGAVEEVVSSPQEALEVFWRGCSNRSTAATLLNRESSRSHAVFTLFISSERSDGTVDLRDVRFARFNLVDLAGSERQASTQTMGLRLKEAGNINKSLLALANVINALALGDLRHPPYRDSKLTFLLRDSLGGNSKTAVIATVSPSPNCQGETLSTLRFAQRAKLVKNRPTLNQDVQGTLSELQAEIIRLRNLKGSSQDVRSTCYDFNALLFSISENQRLKEDIKRLEEQINLQLQTLERKEMQLAQERLAVKLKNPDLAIVSINCHPEITKYASENLDLKARISQLESYLDKSVLDNYKNYCEEINRKLLDLTEVSMLNPIIQTTDSKILEDLKTDRDSLQNELTEIKLEVKEKFGIISQENETRLKELRETLNTEFQLEKRILEERISILNNQIKQMEAENGRRLEMQQTELELEKRSAERLAADNALLRGDIENERKTNLSLREKILQLEQDIRSIQCSSEQHTIHDSDHVISSNSPVSSNNNILIKGLEEKIAFLNFSLENAQIDTEHLMAKYNEEISAFKNQAKLHVEEIEELKAQNDQLVKHNNIRQKLNYHIKIKQENNELREEVTRLNVLLVNCKCHK